MDCAIAKRICGRVVTIWSQDKLMRTVRTMVGHALEVELDSNLRTLCHGCLVPYERNGASCQVKTASCSDGILKVQVVIVYCRTDE
jgi:hypothetical protein